MLDAVAEELDVRARNRLAAAGVGHEVEHAAVELLLGDRGVGHPEHDVARVAPDHSGREQIGPGPLERRAHRDPLVEVPLARLEVQLPGGHLRPAVAGLIALEDPPAEASDVDLLPIQLAGPRLDVLLHVVQQLVDKDFVGHELHGLAVAEAVFNGRALAGGLRRHRLEAPPVAHDLLEPRPCVGPARRLRASAPIVSRLRILAAVLEDARELLQGGRAIAPRVLGQLLVELDEVELAGQLEAADARGQPGDGLILAQRVQGVRAALVLPGIVDRRAAEVPAILGHGLHAELAVQEVGELHAHGARLVGIDLHGLGQAPPPALAVGLRLLKGPRQAMKHGIAVFVHRCAAGLGVVAPAWLVVGQDRQVGEVLESPALETSALVEPHAGPGEQKVRRRRTIIVLHGQRHGSDHELQGADPVPLLRVGHLAAAAVRAALEFAADDEPLMRHLQVGLGRSPQEAPVLLVDRDHGLAQGVDLAGAVQSLQCLDRHAQVAAHRARIAARVERQLAQALVGVLEVALLEGLLRPRAIRILPRGLDSPCAERAHDDHSCRNHPSQTRVHVHQRDSSTRSTAARPGKTMREITRHLTAGLAAPGAFPPTRSE